MQWLNIHSFPPRIYQIWSFGVMDGSEHPGQPPSDVMPLDPSDVIPPVVGQSAVILPGFVTPCRQEKTKPDTRHQTLRHSLHTLRSRICYLLTFLPILPLTKSYMLLVNYSRISILCHPAYLTTSSTQPLSSNLPLPTLSVTP